MKDIYEVKVFMRKPDKEKTKLYSDYDAAMRYYNKMEKTWNVGSVSVRHFTTSDEGKLIVGYYKDPE